MNLKYTEIEPKLLQILYDKEALDVSSGISSTDLYTELNNTFHSYNIEDKPKFDRTRFYEIFYNLEEWDLIKAESPKSKEIKFYERMKEQFKLIYLTKRGEYFVQHRMSTAEIEQFKITSLLIISLSQQGTREMEKASGLGSIVRADKNYNKELYRLGDKKEGITIEEFLKILNDNPEEKISYDIIKASFDLLEDKKIIIPSELSVEKRFRINAEYDVIFSKILQLFDSILNKINAKWKIKPLDQMEEKWFVSMYGQTKFTRQNLEMYNRRKTIKEFERSLTQSEIERYRTCFEDLKKQIENTILNSSGDLKRYSALFYLLVTMNNQFK